VGAVLLLFLVVGCASAVPPEVVGKLPEDQARQLSVYSTHHAALFDLRIHSMETCPFLTYMPNSLAMNHDSKEYAVWLLKFYRAKHTEEKALYKCTCEKELSSSAAPASSSRPPEPRPADKPKQPN
jgi:hypothetical protein